MNLRTATRRAAKQPAAPAPARTRRTAAAKAAPVTTTVPSGNQTANGRVATGTRKPAATAEKDRAIAQATAKPAARVRAAAKASTAPKALAAPAKPAVRGKPAPAPATPAPAPRAGGSVAAHNRTLADRVLAALDAEFAKDTDADRLKVANWLKTAGTGKDSAGMRYWPAKRLPRPTHWSWHQAS